MNTALRSALLASIVWGLSACGLVGPGDALTRDMTPQQAAACRRAVAEEIARQGILPEQVRRVHYQRISGSQRGAIRQGAGYEAWVYPKKEGPGALIIELSEGCQIRGARYYSGSGPSGAAD